MKRMVLGLFLSAGASFSQSVVIDPFSRWTGESAGYQVDLSSDSVAYVTGRSKGLSILDFRTPGGPKLLGQINPVPGHGSVRTLPLPSRRALVSSGDWYGVYSVDLSDPAVPTLSDSLPRRAVNGMASNDSLVFLPYYEKGISIFKVSLGGKFDSLSFLKLSGSAWDVAAHDSLVAVAGGLSGMHVVSVSDPRNPKLLSTGASPSPATGHVFQPVWWGNLIWSAISNGQVALYDAKDPRSIRLIKSKSIGSNVYRIACANGVIFVSNRTGVTAFDAKDTSLTPLMSWNSTASSPFVHGVAANDSLLFALDQIGDGLTVLKWTRIGVCKLLAPLSVTRNVKPEFRWTSVGAATRYAIEVSEDSQFVSPVMSLALKDTSLAMPISLHPGKWWWRISVTPGNQVATGVFEVLSDTLPFLHAFNGDTLNDSFPTFSWSAAKGYQGMYRVQISAEPGMSSAMAFVQSDTLLRFPAQLEKGKWFWRVSTTGGNSQIDSFYLDPKASLALVSRKSTGDMIQWHGRILRIPSEETVEFHDLKGTLLARSRPEVGSVLLDLTRVPKGMGILRGKSWARKIVLP